MGVPSLNDLAVDGTLNTTNQTNLSREAKDVCPARLFIHFYRINIRPSYVTSNNGYCRGRAVTPPLAFKKTHGFNSCIVISVYPLDISLIKKATEYRNN